LGFDFDSSIFPSYRPGVYANLDKPLTPYQPSSTESLLEIPIAADPRTRIPICLSYLELFGRPYVKYLEHTQLPDPLVFNTHLQDIYHTDSHEQLDQPKRFIMKRNLDRSEELFTRFVSHLKDRGYTFTTATDIAKEYRDSTSGTELTYDESSLDSEHEELSSEGEETDQTTNPSRSNTV